MSFFEKKFGKYAIERLPLVIILCYGVGYIIEFINPNFLNYLSLDPYKIIHGQIWRLVSWIILPPGTTNILFTLLLLFCVYSIAVSIERVIGTYQFNVYIFTGILLTVVSAFLLMAVYWIFGGKLIAAAIFDAYGALISSYYIYLSLFVVFALSFPDARFLFMFFIPVKAKWMIILYAVEFVYDFYIGNVFTRVAMVAALLNFGIFLLRNKTGRMHFSPKEIKRKMEFNRAYYGKTGDGVFSAGGAAGRTTTDRMRSASSITRHKCAICGRTELNAPDMQFRFCSKCEGNYEYCEEHLYTHTHIKMS